MFKTAVRQVQGNKWVSALAYLEIKKVYFKMGARVFKYAGA